MLSLYQDMSTMVWLGRASVAVHVQLRRSLEPAYVIPVTGYISGIGAKGTIEKIIF